MQNISEKEPTKNRSCTLYNYFLVSILISNYNYQLQVIFLQYSTVINQLIVWILCYHSNIYIYIAADQSEFRNTTLIFCWLHSQIPVVNREYKRSYHYSHVDGSTWSSLFGLEIEHVLFSQRVLSQLLLENMSLCIGFSDDIFLILDNRNKTILQQQAYVNFHQVHLRKLFSQSLVE